MNGTLIARGTEANRITFTSSAADPQPGDWGYLNFTTVSTSATFDNDGVYTSGSAIEYATIEYAGGLTTNDNAALRMGNATPWLNHVT